jgi:predicted esterase
VRSACRDMAGTVRLVVCSRARRVRIPWSRAPTADGQPPGASRRRPVCDRWPRRGQALGAGAALVAWPGRACTPTRSTKSSTHRIRAIERTAVLNQAAATAASAPLVIALHGRGQSTKQLRENLKLDAVADREGLAVRYPDAVDLSWNYGPPINSPAPMVGSEPVDDVGSIRRLLDDVVSRKIADARRVYVVGSSRGALMTFTLACTLDDRIAAAAALITGITHHQPARLSRCTRLTLSPDRTSQSSGSPPPATAFSLQGVLAASYRNPAQVTEQPTQSVIIPPGGPERAKLSGLHRACCADHLLICSSASVLSTK